MTANEKTITTFETRLRQLILRFQELKKENTELCAVVENGKKDLAELRAKLEQQQNDYDSLKMVTWMVPRIGCPSLYVTSTSALQS